MKHKLYQRKGLFGLSYKLTVLFACLFALGCTSENEALTTTDSVDGGEIQLGASVNLETRATGLGFELNDRIGLYLAKWPDATTPGMLSNTGNYADNALFELNTLPDSWTTTPKRYYPADGGALDFYAYYPYRDPAFATGTTLNLTVASDQSAYADYTRSDFMVAKTDGVKRSTSKVHLDFYHRLSQMVFVLKPGTGFTVSDLTGAKVKVVNAVVDGTFDLSQGASGRPTEGSTRQDVTPYGTWTVGDSSLTGMMAIVMPQYIDARTYVEVTVGSRKFAFKPTTPIEMRPGCSKEFTITVSNTGIDIETQIHPWNNCGAESGEAEEEGVIMRMIATDQSIAFSKDYNKDGIWVDWGDGTKNFWDSYTRVMNHSYQDGLTKHEIIFYGTRKSMPYFKCASGKLESIDISGSTSMTIFMCYNHLLTTLDFSQNTLLTTIVCDKNQLTTLDFSQNTLLTNIVCNNNQLTTLNVSQNLALTDLECGNNPLDSINVSNNLKLEWLGCENMNLGSIDVSKNPQLYSLACSGNRLTKLDVSKNPQLYSLACSGNWLTKLDVSKNPELGVLEVSGNQLDSLDISNNLKLMEISCMGNPFFDDPVKAQGFVNLLPDLTGKAAGKIVATGEVKTAIQANCDARNWTIVEKIRP